MARTAATASREGPTTRSLSATATPARHGPSKCGKRKDVLTTGGIEGGDQKDWMSGGQGDDDPFGNNGNDTLKTGGHVWANDEANSGPNTDTCVIDAGDTATSCER